MYVSLHRIQIVRETRLCQRQMRAGVCWDWFKTLMFAVDRCSGLNVCSFNLQLDRVGASLWGPGLVTIRYACVDGKSCNPPSAYPHQWRSLSLAIIFTDRDIYREDAIYLDMGRLIDRTSYVLTGCQCIDGSSVTHTLPVKFHWLSCDQFGNKNSVKFTSLINGPGWIVHAVSMPNHPFIKN